MDPRVAAILSAVKKYKPEKVILFGSHARGTSDRHSDIDLVIIKRTRKRFLDRIKEVLAIIRPNFAIDILVYSPQEFKNMLAAGNAFLEFIVKDGTVIYEKS